MAPEQGLPHLAGRAGPGCPCCLGLNRFRAGEAGFRDHHGADLIAPGAC